MPLPQSDLLEVLVALSRNDDAELAENAQNTLAAQDLSELENTIKSNEIAPQVLAYFAVQENLSPMIQETILTNPKMPEIKMVP